MGTSELYALGDSSGPQVPGEHLPLALSRCPPQLQGSPEARVRSFWNDSGSPGGLCPCPALSHLQKQLHPHRLVVPAPQPFLVQQDWVGHKHMSGRLQDRALYAVALVTAVTY